MDFIEKCIVECLIIKIGKILKGLYLNYLNLLTKSLQKEASID